MPVRIAFDDLAMRPHLCPDYLKDYVVEDIRERYGTEVDSVRQVESIHMDPGGMARMNPDLIQFEIQGTKFDCNAEHLVGVQLCLQKRYRIVESEHGQLARVYFWQDLMVVPATYLWALNTHLDFNIDQGIAARNDLVQALNEANARASAPDPLPENVVPLFEDDENIH